MAIVIWTHMRQINELFDDIIKSVYDLWWRHTHTSLSLFPFLCVFASFYFPFLFYSFFIIIITRSGVWSVLYWTYMPNKLQLFFCIIRTLTWVRIVATGKDRPKVHLYFILRFFIVTNAFFFVSSFHPFLHANVSLVHASFLLLFRLYCGEFMGHRIEKITIKTVLATKKNDLLENDRQLFYFLFLAWILFLVKLQKHTEAIAINDDIGEKCEFYKIKIGTSNACVRYPSCYFAHFVFNWIYVALLLVLGGDT